MVLNDGAGLGFPPRLPDEGARRGVSTKALKDGANPSSATTGDAGETGFGGVLQQLVEAAGANDGTDAGATAREPKSRGRSRAADDIDRMPATDAEKRASADRPADEVLNLFVLGDMARPMREIVKDEYMDGQDSSGANGAKGAEGAEGAETFVGHDFSRANSVEGVVADITGMTEVMPYDQGTVMPYDQGTTEVVPYAAQQSSAERPSSARRAIDKPTEGIKTQTDPAMATAQSPENATGVTSNVQIESAPSGKNGNVAPGTEAVNADAVKSLASNRGPGTPSTQKRNGTTSAQAARFVPSPPATSAISNLSSASKPGRDSSAFGQNLADAPKPVFTDRRPWGQQALFSMESRLVNTTSPAIVAGATQTAVAQDAAMHAELPGQIVQSIRLQALDGGGEATVRLRPEYLGELVVSVKLESGAVTASLQSDSPAVRRWIETHESSLRQGLAEQGLQLERLTVTNEAPKSEPQAGERRRQSQADERPRQQSRRPSANEEDATFEVVV